jgi:hypothetical protein
MATRLIMVKTNPNKEGYGLLQTVTYDASYRAEVCEEKVQELTIKARDTWSWINPEWKFRVIDPRDYHHSERDADGYPIYYSDSDPHFKTVTRGIYVTA